MKDGNICIEKDQYKNVTSPVWCPGPGKATLQPQYANSMGEEQPSFMDSMRNLLYSEDREPSEKPDKIEAHRKMMETPREDVAALPSTRELVTQRHYAVERKGRLTMLQYVSRTLNENVIIRRYLSPGIGTNNSAMLFLASTIFSSNRYIFELLNEGGFFSPKSQMVVNSVASEFLNQSKKLTDLILKAERSSGEAVKKAVVSGVNEFVATSNKLSKSIQLEYEAKAAAIGYANETLLKSLLQKRNQISDCLYSFFQRTVEVQKNVVSASTKSVTNISKDLGDTVRLLSDAERFTKLLYMGLNMDRIASSTGIDDMNNFNKVKRTSYKKHPKITTDPTTDTSDGMSTASSFMNYLNMSSLSATLDEEGVGPRGESFTDTHLDAVFERMNLNLNLSLQNESMTTQNEIEEIPNPEIKTNTTSNRWSWKPSKRTINQTKMTAREKRKQLIIARSEARQGKKEKRFGRKKKPAKKGVEKQDKTDESSVEQSDIFKEGKIGLL
eukprot:CAMPEP_0197175684 /NCGR_PEP_ID=MMETSP1423-20130617/1831_1 /TAXON_ID=476441 /ORGANISM="Pseudo-nitzschia heimii, Strain UNC1101" /LENGTH=498 /DNA_ID=CAMNT_0042624897 /DNA_START=56 /DNA_END=1549 /DNA_ORIENTATION=+